MGKYNSDDHYIYYCGQVTVAGKNWKWNNRTGSKLGKE